MKFIKLLKYNNDRMSNYFPKKPLVTGLNN